MLDERERREFAGISFGVGIAATYIPRARDARIDEIEVIGEPAVVRVKGRTRAPTRLLIESHYFLTTCKDTFGAGPFLALQPSPGEVIDAIGLGLMAGFRRKGTPTQSFNVGLGILIDAASPVLGAGVEANKPLPPGEAVARLQKRSVLSGLLLFSFSF